MKKVVNFLLRSNICCKIKTLHWQFVSYFFVVPFLDLKEREEKFEAQKADRDFLVKEIEEKQTQLKKLNEQILVKTEEAAKLAEKPSSAASGAEKTPDQNKLDYFEGEVRRLESQLTQQKVSYEKKMRELESKVAETQAELEKSKESAAQ